MIAQEWRIKFPQRDARKNMRDYATAEELKVISALQVLSHYKRISTPRKNC